MSKLRHISRFEYGRTIAWWVRVYRGEKLYSKLFSDRAYGGKRKALAKALAYRDRLLKRVPLPIQPQPVPPGPGYVKRETRHYYDSQGTRRSYEAWTGWIRIAPKKAASTNWSISKWGSLGAKKMAEAWLKEVRKEQKKNYAKHT